MNTRDAGPGPVVVAGAGPAGLTAALELQARGVRDVIVLEADGQVGGLSKTVVHGTNRIDIGGHRFFSKSAWVMDWWSSLLPVVSGEGPMKLSYRGATATWEATTAKPPEDAHSDRMLVRQRASRIYFDRQFFDYPLSVSLRTLHALGMRRSLRFGISWLASHIRPRKEERTLEDFLVNRFGVRLYHQFFKSYTEKVWGVPCDEISAAWGAQRIKSLSLGNVLSNALRPRRAAGRPTSLTERFIYPALGPGQMWEAAARKFVEQGGTLRMGHRVSGIEIVDGSVRAVSAETSEGARVSFRCSHLVSTMPVVDLVRASAPAWPQRVRDVAQALAYRGFITVGLLYPDGAMTRTLHDQWIYVQDPGVRLARIQVYNNWSPAMVGVPGHVWLGLEFFCVEGDDLWRMEDRALVELGERELRQIGLVDATHAEDSTVIRAGKAYPAYFGPGYRQFQSLREAFDRIDNLFLVGRNGMHRYNNQDHSMLTAREAADQIATGRVDKAAIWAIHVGDEYDEAS